MLSSPPAKGPCKAGAIARVHPAVKSSWLALILAHIVVSSFFRTSHAGGKRKDSKETQITRRRSKQYGRPYNKKFRRGAFLVPPAVHEAYFTLTPAGPRFNYDFWPANYRKLDGPCHVWQGGITEPFSITSKSSSLGTWNRVQ